MDIHATCGKENTQYEQTHCHSLEPAWPIHAKQNSIHCDRTNMPNPLKFPKANKVALAITCAPTCQRFVLCFQNIHYFVSCCVFALLFGVVTCCLYRLCAFNLSTIGSLRIFCHDIVMSNHHVCHCLTHMWPSMSFQH